MLNQQTVKGMFNLEPDETIFDDFSCEHESKSCKLYVSENNLLFHSGLLGEAKVALKLKEIEDIKQDRGSIKIKMGAQVYEFNNFEDIDGAYQCIQTSWKAFCVENKNGVSVPEEKKANEVTEQKKNVEEVKEELVVEENGIYVEMDDKQTINISLQKYPARENEHIRLVFGFSVAEYYRRFIGEGCAYSDIKHGETLGSSKFVTDGWVDSDETPGIKTRHLTFDYKLAKNPFVSSAYTIKESTLEYTP